MWVQKLVLIIFISVISAFCGEITYPHGKVTVLDRTLQRQVAVQNVKVQITSNRITFETFTDTNGNFSFPRFPRNSKVDFTLIWEHRNKDFVIRTKSTGKARLEGPRNAQSWNLAISNPEQMFYGTIFRAGSRYISSSFCTEYNKPKNISIKAYFDMKPFGKGAARYMPMTENLQVWGLNKWGERLSDVRLFSYVAHEFGHAHHDAFFQGGSQYLKTELRLKESWSEGVKYYLALNEYSDTCKDVKTYSKQHPRFDGWQNNDWRFGRKVYYNYTPLMIDLTDTLDQEAIDDRVSGYTLSQIQKVMEEKSCKDFDSFKLLLKMRYDNPTEQYLDVLFQEMEKR